MIKLFIRIGVLAIMTVFMIVLCLLGIASLKEDEEVWFGHQVMEYQPVLEVKIAATVVEVNIARPGETADVVWVTPYDRKQWRVVFKIDKVLYGRFNKPQLSFLVHSPSVALGVTKTGQKIALERYGGSWQRVQVVEDSGIIE